MKCFWYKFLVCVLSLGMLYPTWISTGAQKAKAGVDTTAPYLTDVGFTSDDGVNPIMPLPGSLAGGYYLKTNGNPATNYLLQFSNAASANEPLSVGYYGLYLQSVSGVSTAGLKQYYDDRVGLPGDFRDYLKSAVDGDKPFAYIQGYNNGDVDLVDAAKHDLAFVDTNMTIPGDYPNGSYVLATKTGEGYRDLAGNKGSAIFSLIIDNQPPVVKITKPVENSYVKNNTLIEFTDDDPNLPKCSINKTFWVACESGVTALGDITGFSALPAGVFTLYLRDIDIAGNIGDDEISLNKYIALPAPTNLVVVTGNGEASLTWDIVVGSDHYNVYYQKSSDATYTGPIAVAENFTRITGLENGKSYRFIIRAADQYDNESADAWLEATPIAPEPVKVVLTAAPTVQDAVVAQPETPVVTPEVTPPTEETGPEVGQIKGEETVATEEEDINWTPWIILFVLIVLAGAATGGYFYWFGNEEEEIVSEKVIEKTRKSNGKKGSGSKPSAKKSKRW